MKYMLLIHHEENGWEKLTEAERKAIYGEYRKFTEDIIASGNYVAGDELRPTTTATSVRVREGKRLVTDGPFAETREQLGGYYLIEAHDLDEAMKIAERVPVAKHGTVEIRPVLEISGLPA